MKGGRRVRRAERRRWLWLVPLLLLALCCGRCPEPPPPPEPAVGAEPMSIEAPAPSTPATPPAAKTPRRVRPDYRLPQGEALPWLGALRLQAGARGTRLAACFSGISRPGALRWTALVDPKEGRVSDATLDATLSSDELSTAQRSCALAILAEPYALASDGAPSTPSRVALVVEF
jgi:hypothetical protein